MHFLYPQNSLLLTLKPSPIFKKISFKCITIFNLKVEFSQFFFFQDHLKILYEIIDAWEEEEYPVKKSSMCLLMLWRGRFWNYIFFLSFKVINFWFEFFKMNNILKSRKYISMTYFFVAKRHKSWMLYVIHHINEN